MFRYREPRTFRSIYIDVVHVLSAITHIATRLNFACKYQYNFNQKAIEKFLQISPF
ncbi:MAG TPA: hypothetical protein LFV90_05940 [Rickettsia endosymbiont of Columbicola hoogstraali]|nr:hypothetical protein [Rickettsia endosymbiont of Columbicola hoogstraali]